MSGGKANGRRTLFYSHLFSFLVVLYRTIISPCPCPLSSSPLLLVFATRVMADLWLLASVTPEDNHQIHQTIKTSWHHAIF
jgi:hypothetical protein